MSDLNAALFTGRVTQKPEILARGESNKAIIRIANNTYGGKDADEVALFLDLEVWGSRADWAAQYLDVGTSLFVKGKLAADVFDGSDGQRKTRFYVKVEDIGFAGSKATERSSTNDQPPL
jgi:single-stranded DNA-binding protein